MNRFSFTDLKQLPKSAWIIFGFLYLNRLAFFMSIPYLVFFLTDAHYSAIEIGAIISAQWTAFGLGGFLLGHLGDSIGKKNAMILSLLLTALLSFSMAYCNNFLSFFLINLSIGFSRSIFSSAMPAYLTDVISKASHYLAFNLRFMIINLAGSTGPLIGVYYANQHSTMLFKISAVIFLISSFLMRWLLPKDRKITVETHNKIRFIKGLEILSYDRQLLMLFIAFSIFWLVYGQLEAPIAQVLEIRTPLLATHLYGIMWVINTLMIVFLQIPIAAFTKNFSLYTICFIGIILITSGFLVLAFFPSSFAFVTSITVITLGEILISPLASIIVAKISPEDKRSTYFGVLTFASIGGGLSALLGSIILSYSSSEILFIIMAGLIFSSWYFYYQSLKQNL